MVTDFRVALKQWREIHPLQVYLSVERVTQGDAATKVGVSRHTMGVWLQGTSNPSPEKMAAVADLMGWPLANLQTAWAKWEGQKP